VTLYLGPGLARVAACLNAMRFGSGAPLRYRSISDNTRLWGVKVWAVL